MSLLLQGSQLINNQSFLSNLMDYCLRQATTDQSETLINLI